MQPNDMERTFREKMKSHTPAWDKSKNREAIAGSLPEERKRRPWWLLLILGAVIAGTAMWYSMASQREMKLENTAAATAQTTEKEAVYPQVTTPGNSAGVVSPQVKTTIGDGDQVIAKSTKTQSPVAKTKFENNLLPTSEKEATVREVEENTSKNQNTPVGKEVQEAPLPPIAGKSDMELIFQSYTMTKLPVELNPLTIAPKGIELPTLLSQRVEVINNKTRFGLEIYGGIGRPIRRFHTDSPEMENYLNEREEQEKVLESVEAGILLHARLGHGWSIATGIELQQINEKFKWQELKTELIPVYSDSAYYYFDALDQPRFIGDTVQATLTESRKVIHFNQHTFINLPILAGYEKDLGNFSLRASGGPILSFYRGYKGLVDPG